MFCIRHKLTPKGKHVQVRGPIEYRSLSRNARRETDESKRKVIEQLLAEEEVKLAAAKQKAKDQKTG